MDHDVLYTRKTSIAKGQPSPEMTEALIKLEQSRRKNMIALKVKGNHNTSKDGYDKCKEGIVVG